MMYLLWESLRNHSAGSKVSMLISLIIVTIFYLKDFSNIVPGLGQLITHFIQNKRQIPHPISPT